MNVSKYQNIYVLSWKSIIYLSKREVITQFINNNSRNIINHSCKVYVYQGEKVLYIFVREILYFMLNI